MKGSPRRTGAILLAWLAVSVILWLGLEAMTLVDAVPENHITAVVQKAFYAEPGVFVWLAFSLGVLAGHFFWGARPTQTPTSRRGCAVGVLLAGLLAVPATAEERPATDAPTFLSGYVWKQALFQGTPEHGGTFALSKGDVWGGRVVGGVGLGRLGLELRLDASGLKDQFDIQDPATFQSLESYAMAHLVVWAGRGIQVGPALVAGSVTAFETGAPWAGFGVDVAGAGVRVGGFGSELELLVARTSFLSQDPSVRVVAVAHLRLNEQLAVVADAVSGQDGFVRCGIAVRAF